MKKIIISCLFLVVTIIIVPGFWYGDKPPCRNVVSELDNFAKLSFEILGEINSYIISLSTLLIGGLSVVVLKLSSILDEGKRTTARTLISISGIFSIGSLYCSLMFYHNLAEAAMNRCVELSDKMNVTYAMQTYFLLAGAVFFMFLLFLILGNERRTK